MSDFHILSLSGGGFKGLFSAKVLEILEKQFSCPIAQKFDLVSGTSIGGILALAIALEIPAKEMVNFFYEKGEIIFPPKKHLLQNKVSGLIKPRYSNDGLKEVLQDLFSDKRIADLPHRVIIPTVNYLKGDTHVIKTRHNEKIRFDPDLKLVDVALATSAAPIYFPSYNFGRGDYLDGGLVANHPGLFAYMEAQEYLQQLPESIYQLHIGTLYQNCSSSGESSARRKGLIQWNKGLIDIIFSSQEKSTANILSILMKERYYSINHEVNANQSCLIGLDKTDKEAIRVLTAFAEIAAQSYLGESHFNIIRNHFSPNFIPIPM